MAGSAAGMKTESTMYNQKEERQETNHSDLMTQIKAFPEDSVLTPTKSLESASGASLLVQEMVVRDVETFNKAELRPAETQEPMTGAELLKKELDVASLNTEVVNFDKAGLKETEVGVKDILPNERDIKLEREKVELIGVMENMNMKI